ncbi:MAG: hypothetical protein ACPGXY_05125, partial [Alphaproteobacteria bacterium]
MCHLARGAVFLSLLLISTCVWATEKDGDGVDYDLMLKQLQKHSEQAGGGNSNAGLEPEAEEPKASPVLEKKKKKKTSKPQKVSLSEKSEYTLFYYKRVKDVQEEKKGKKQPTELEKYKKGAAFLVPKEMIEYKLKRAEAYREALQKILRTLQKTSPGEKKQAAEQQIEERNGIMLKLEQSRGPLDDLLAGDIQKEEVEKALAAERQVAMDLVRGKIAGADSVQQVSGIQSLIAELQKALQSDRGKLGAIKGLIEFQHKLDKTVMACRFLKDAYTAAEAFSRKFNEEAGKLAQTFTENKKAIEAAGLVKKKKKKKKKAAASKIKEEAGDASEDSEEDEIVSMKATFEHRKKDGKRISFPEKEMGQRTEQLKEKAKDYHKKIRAIMKSLPTEEEKVTNPMKKQKKEDEYKSFMTARGHLEHVRLGLEALTKTFQEMQDSMQKCDAVKPINPAVRKEYGRDKLYEYWNTRKQYWGAIYKTFLPAIILMNELKEFLDGYKGLHKLVKKYDAGKTYSLTDRDSEEDTKLSSKGVEQVQSNAVIYKRACKKLREFVLGFQETYQIETMPVYHEKGEIPWFFQKKEGLDKLKTNVSTICTNLTLAVTQLEDRKPDNGANYSKRLTQAREDLYYYKDVWDCYVVFLEVIKPFEEYFMKPEMVEAAKQFWKEKEERAAEKE